MVDSKKVMQIRKGGIITMITVILHRLLRIWPTYATTIFIFWKIVPYVGGGPRWF
jgi:hypothetical protein